MTLDPATLEHVADWHDRQRGFFKHHAKTVEAVEAKNHLISHAENHRDSRDYFRALAKKAAEPKRMNASRFDEVWWDLAEQGACDGYGSAEHRRVKHEFKELPLSTLMEWRDDWQSCTIADFIRWRANAGSSGRSCVDL